MLYLKLSSIKTLPAEYFQYTRKHLQYCWLPKFQGNMKQFKCTINLILKIVKDNYIIKIIRTTFYLFLFYELIVNAYLELVSH